MVSEFLPYAEGGFGVASTVRAARRSSTMKETVSGNASLVQWWSHLDAFSVGGRIIKGRQLHLTAPLSLLGHQDHFYPQVCFNNYVTFKQFDGDAIYVSEFHFVMYVPVLY